MLNESAPKVYRAGTLEYTKRGLVFLFVWLLWGDVVFTLLQAVEPNVLPFLLKSLKGKDTSIAVCIITIPMIFNITICPIVSYWSDRYRSRWGRRIPFLLVPAPVVSFFLILTGFSKEIGHYLFTDLRLFHGMVPNELAGTIILIGALVVGYQFFNMFAASVYWYLFNDIVPVEFLGRFMSLFRAVGTLAGAGFSFFIFPYAKDQPKWIFVGIGLLYLFGYTLMCLRIREGEYPPPPERKGTGLTAFLDNIRVYFTECCRHRFYWYLYVSTGFAAAAGAVGVYANFRNLDIGLTMRELGLIGGVVGIVAAVLLIPAGHYVDKKHPLRLGNMAMLWGLLATPVNVIFLWNYPHHIVLWLTLITTALILPIGIVATAAEVPLGMRLLPRSRYGQFCGAAAMVRSVMYLVAGTAAGVWVEWLGRYCHNTLHIPGDYYYRLTFIWAVFFSAVAYYFRVLLYREWQKLGGDDNFIPPTFENDPHELLAQGLITAEEAEAALQAQKIASELPESDEAVILSRVQSDDTSVRRD